MSNLNSLRRVQHYNMFEFDQQNTNLVKCNNVRKYQYNGELDHHYRNQEILRIGNSQTIQYQLNLINNSLKLQVFDSGVGSYIKKGQYIRIRKRLYNIDNSLRQLDKSTITYHHGSKQNSHPFQLILSISKLGFKARAYLNRQMAIKINKQYTNNKIQQFILQIQIIAVCDEPLSRSFNDLQQIHNQVIKLAIKGDLAFEKSLIQQSLAYYQKVVDTIHSQYYRNQIQHHCNQLTKQQIKTIFKQFKQQKQQNFQQHIKQLHKNKQISLQMKSLSQKIIFKAILVAYFAQEHFKVIKWSSFIMPSLQVSKKIKLYMIRAQSFAQLQEFQRAFNDIQNALKLCKQQQIDNNQIQQAKLRVTQKYQSFNRQINKSQRW